MIQLNDVPPGNDENGIGDIFQSFFFSPKAPSSIGWILGAGPAINMKTATDDLLGTGKWSAGPKAVALKQEHGLTYGALANHVWSFAGNSDRSDVDATWLQLGLRYWLESPDGAAESWGLRLAYSLVILD